MANFKIDVIRGNIVNIYADAIVNSANNSLECGYGSNKTIFNSSGNQLIEECRKIEFCETGKVVCTNAYNAPASKIIHAVAPYWHGGYDDEAKKLTSCYLEIMKCAQQNGFETISIPAIATGDGGYPLEEAAEIAISTIKSYIANNDYNVNVRFMCIDTDTLNKFRTANEQPFVDISKYLSRNNIKIKAKLKIEEQSYLKSSFFKKEVTEQQKKAVVLMVLKRKLKKVEPNAILLTKITSDKINEKVINKNNGKTGPYVTYDCIENIEFEKDSVSFVINPVCVKREFETKTLCNLSRQEEIRKKEQVEKENNQNYYKEFNIEKELEKEYAKDTKNNVVTLSNDFSNPALGFENDFKVEVKDVYYTGKAIKPEVKSESLNEEDFEVEYDENIEVGVGTMTIKGKGRYTGTLIKKFNILKRKITEDDFIIKLEDYVYDGKEHTPYVESEVIDEDNYEVIYSDNIDAGIGSITIRGVKNCVGEIKKYFDINPREIEDKFFEIDTDDKVYTGSSIIPKLASKLNQVEYEVLYNNNVDVGIAEIIIKGKNNFKGGFVKNFNILKRQLTNDDFKIDLTSKVYSGEPIKVKVESSINEESYDVRYEKNINVGNATIVIVGKGNYEGTIIDKFEIKPQPISKECFKPIPNQTFKSKPITPKLVPANSYIKEKEYDIEYDDNINVGTAKIKVNGKGNFKGSAIVNFEIIPRK